MRASLTPLLVVALLIAGCGTAQQRSSSATESSTVETSTEMSAKTAPSPPQDPDDQGGMTFQYEDATSPEAISGRKLMAKAGLLEFLAADANEGLKIPYDIPIIGMQCDEANAFWSPSRKTMFICYEDLDLARQIFVKDGDADPDKAALNTEIATFYHELGHMAIDIYHLPATGREEDVADQLAAFILLQPDDDGKLDPDKVQTVIDFSREFDGYAAMNPGPIPEEYFADVHSLDQTRKYDLLCWAYGADPVGNAEIVADGRLPQGRADRCEHEFDRMSSAWYTLLEPHLK